jgi:three-Cys-motif partner protein
VTSQFFDEQEDQSRIKAAIVVEYFGAWATIMAKRSERLAYIDLFAGPGRYKDGSESTPLLILRRILAAPTLSAKVVTIFNDVNTEFATSLEGEINSLPELNTLRHPPEVSSEEVGQRIVSLFAAKRMVPTLTFMDPWGYKGLSRDLIGSVIKDFGCEAVFFFNYNRINPATENGKVESHIEALFSARRLADLREAMETATPARRESMILRALGDSLQEFGGDYLIPFRFLRGGRPSHYVCFLTKNRRGYDIMKDVMAKYGTVDEDGVPIFEYYPPVEGRQLTLDVERPLSRLPWELLKTFSGRSLSMQALFDEHNVGRPFLLKKLQEGTNRTRNSAPDPMLSIKAKT